MIPFQKTSDLDAIAERLLAIQSGVVIGQTLRATVLHSDLNPQEAAVAFERVLELDPELRQMPLSRRIFWTQFTDDLIASGRIPEARDALKKFLAKSPDAELMDRLGRIYALEGSLDDAQRCFMQAAELDPNEHAPLVGLAKIALQHNDRDLALKYLSQANLLAPREYAVLYSLESVYRQLGYTDQADRIQEDLTHLCADSDSPPRFGNWRKHEL